MTVKNLTPVPFGFTPGGAGADLNPANWSAMLVTDTIITFPNSGDVVVGINNGTAGTITVAPVVTRKIQGATPTLAPRTMPAGAVEGFGPFPTNDFGETVSLAVTGAATTVKVKAYEMTRA